MRRDGRANYLGAGDSPFRQHGLPSVAFATMLILSLSGCATTQTPIPIKIPVPVACVKVADLPKSPEILPDSELAKLPDGQLVLTIAAERLDLKRYHGEASALLLACAE